MSDDGADAEDVARALATGAAQAAREVVRERARETPVLTSGTLTERCGGQVVLKAENLQRTGSFKLRGALNRVAALAGRDDGRLRQRRQPRPGARLRGPRARSRLRGLHAGRGGGREGRRGRRATAAMSRSAATASTTASRRRASAPPRPAPSSCTRSTIRT